MKKAETYFLDTSFILGLAIEDDKHHDKAIKQMRKINDKKWYVNNSVIGESVTVAYNKTKDVKYSNEIFLILNDVFEVINEYEIDHFNQKTMKVFNIRKGDLSFIDAGIITTIKENNIDELLTFDKKLKAHRIN